MKRIINWTMSSFIKRRKKTNEEDSSPSSSSSVPPSSSSSRICTHHLFPSFRGEDVRRDFLSHILAEFQRMGITPFIDNEIRRGESIGPDLIRAIQESKIAVVLLSKNYASSKWCLDELVEIMKCREELGQAVMAIFYKVDPSHVKKLTGDFGEVFRKTCVGKCKKSIERWKQALEKVATIAGYHSSNWDNEATMIQEIAIDISNKLNNSVSSSDFDGLVGMRAHLEKMKPLLCLDSNEVRMIGIWGPPGIGKTTIARVAYNQLSTNFQLSVFMDNVKASYSGPYFDDYYTKLQLQQQFMSQMTNHKDMKVSHLGVARDRLKDKKVLVVLDGVNHLVQLDAMAKETWWFGPGSRIMVTTQDQKLFRAHNINHIYEVDFPPNDEAFQIFCMYAFGQKSPKNGFEELAWEVTKLAGKLPLGLRVMGSYFRGMSKQEWTKSLPKLSACLDTDIQSILKLSYDALDDEDKDLFLHIACFFNHAEIKRMEVHLAKKFLEVRQRLNVLAEKSLISLNGGCVEMHSLLKKLGIEIVRKQSIHELGRKFLVDRREIGEVLAGDAACSKSVISIDFYYGKEGLDINERAFKEMPNLRFLRFYGDCHIWQLSRGLDDLSQKLQVLHWSHFPMTCLPSIVKLEFLVELIMHYSKLEKLWEGIKPLPNLKWMDLSESVNLKELPDLSTATNLQELELDNCSSLVKLPSTIGYTNNLRRLNLRGCSSLVELPSIIGKATNLEEWILSNCSNLVELPLSIGNLQKLQRLDLERCSKLEVLPTNINLESLDNLDLTDCSSLKIFPEISTNLKVLILTGTAIEEVPASIRSWPCLDSLHMSYFENLKAFPHAFENITELDLSDTKIQEVPPWIKRISRLDRLVLKRCRKLLSLSHIPDSLIWIDAEDCDSLERLNCSFDNPDIFLKFAKCFKLNQEARDLIIQTPSSEYVVLPGTEVPSYFTHQATSGGSLTVKLNESPLPTSTRFKTCILLVYKGGNEAYHDEKWMKYGPLIVTCKTSKQFLCPVVTKHLYTFSVEVEVISDELVFEFTVNHNDWKIDKCGLLELEEIP